MFRVRWHAVICMQFSRLTYVVHARWCRRHRRVHPNRSTGTHFAEFVLCRWRWRSGQIKAIRSCLNK